MTAQRILKIWTSDATQCPSKDLLAPTGVSSLTHSDFVLNSETNLPPVAGFCQQLISSVYDPLGAVSPVILVSKQILQTLCRQNVSWDDPIPDDTLPLWEKWRSELPLLEKFTFPRCLKPTDFGDPVQTELHSFSDASNNGIGQISYLCMVNRRDEVHVSYLLAKSRVAPLKPISNPRLELTAAVISVNVASMLKSELDIEDIPATTLFTLYSAVVSGCAGLSVRLFLVLEFCF